jgi:hypothetical protein
MKLRTGPEVTVLDVSETGVLVEATVRLLPGSRVDVHVVTRGGRSLVRGRIARAFVSAVGADGVRYRGGLAFDSSIDPSPFGYSMPGTNGGCRDVSGTGYPSMPAEPPVAQPAVATHDEIERLS